MDEPQFPIAFAKLEPFADWALPTETERNKKRLASSMDEMCALRAALLPEFDRVMEYLNGFALDAIPKEALPLLYITLSLAEIAPAVEIYKQPDVIDGFDSGRFVADEDFVLRPIP